jgi:acetyl-CoA C-acetyltransferase
MSGPVRIAVLSAVRTPIGKFGGKLRMTPAPVLGALVGREAMKRASVEPTEVPEVIFGHCIEAGVGQNPARQVLRASGIPDTSGAVTVNMVCGSGMKALHLGAAELRAGEFPLLLAGGMESMDSAPYLLGPRARWGLRYGGEPLEDAMVRDALTDAYDDHEGMGITGERIAKKLHLTREDVDRFAVRSHRAAAAATSTGRFAKEIIAVPSELTASREGLAVDEGPRGDSTVEALGRLKPSFAPDGILTAASSSQLSDGAAALVLASEEEAERRGAKVLAWIHSTQVSGLAPGDVMEAPIPTVKAHLKRTGFRPADFDRVEHNEAFASASIAVQQAFGFSEEQFNVNGGAIALGHPIGASGARIVVTLLHELLRIKGKLGLATLCMGGGNGLSLILDRRDL